MYLIDCRCCRSRISDEARLCSVCGFYLGYRRAVVDETPRQETAPVTSGESVWRELARL